MRNNQHGDKSSGGGHANKDKQILVNFIVKTVEKETGLSLNELKRTKTQKQLYRIGLRYFTTTNKTICEALGIPIEAGTRRKRDLEKEGILKASLKRRKCPYTGHQAHFLTTNPHNYKDLLK